RLDNRAGLETDLKRPERGNDFSDNVAKAAAILTAQRAAKMAELEEARAQHKLAQTQLERATQLAKKNAIANEELAKFQAEAAVAEARVKAHEAALVEADLKLKHALQGAGASFVGKSISVETVPVDRKRAEDPRDQRNRDLERKLDDLDRRFRELE